jgi:hypothetical protein
MFVADPGFEVLVSVGSGLVVVMVEMGTAEELEPLEAR